MLTLPGSCQYDEGVLVEGACESGWIPRVIALCRKLTGEKAGKNSRLLTNPGNLGRAIKNYPEIRIVLQDFRFNIEWLGGSGLSLAMGICVSFCNVIKI